MDVPHSVDRFDEGELEIELIATTPVPYSTLHLPFESISNELIPRLYFIEKFPKHLWLRKSYPIHFRKTSESH